MLTATLPRQGVLGAWLQVSLSSTATQICSVDLWSGKGTPEKLLLPPVSSVATLTFPLSHEFLGESGQLWQVLPSLIWSLTEASSSQAKQKHPLLSMNLVGSLEITSS